VIAQVKPSVVDDRMRPGIANIPGHQGKASGDKLTVSGDNDVNIPLYNGLSAANTIAAKSNKTTKRLSFGTWIFVISLFLM